MLVVNLFAGPGAGKSTIAAGLFHVLKQDGENAELVGEYAKDLTWEGRTDVLRNQIYVLGKQHQRIERLRGKVKVAIVDSPLLLCLIYSRRVIHEPHRSALRVAVGETAIAAHAEFDNVNVFVERTKPYQQVGRNQTEDEARGLDAEIREMLELMQIPHHVVRGDRSAPEAIRRLLYDRAGRLKTGTPAKCGACRGSGEVGPPDDRYVCAHCQGTGDASAARDECVRCQGGGCFNCGGTGDAPAARVERRKQTTECWSCGATVSMVVDHCTGEPR